MKILLLTQWFDPEPVFKGLSFARALARRGHTVEVLTGFPNYPGGRVYPGYRIRLRQQEALDGILVTRVALYPSHDESAVRRIANYTSFAFASVIVGTYSVRRPDVVYVYHPPATTAFPAMVLQALRDVPFVLDIQDLWPDTLAATGMVRSPAMLRMVGAFCGLVYRRAARIVVLSPGFRQRLLERGVDPAKIEVIFNWTHEPPAVSAGGVAAVLKEAGIEGRFTVVFAGTMGRAQALSHVLDAAALAVERVPRALFVFIGAGIERAQLEARARDMGLPNVRFLASRPPAEVAPLLAAADALLVHLRDDPLFSITIPSKTQAYLAAGRPVLMAVRGDAAALVREAGAGVCVSPADPEALATAVSDLSRLDPAALAEMGERGRAYYRRHLSLEAGVDRFEDVFQSVVTAR